MGDETFAGAEVGDFDFRDKVEEEVSDALPRAAGAVVFSEAAGDEVEVFFSLAAAFCDDAGKVFLVFGEFGGIGGGGEGGVEERGFLGAEAGGDGVERFFAVATVGDEFALAEYGQLGGDAGLGHAEGVL